MNPCLQMIQFTPENYFFKYSASDWLSTFDIYLSNQYMYLLKYSASDWLRTCDIYLTSQLKQLY